jgi:hypothetical protein
MRVMQFVRECPAARYFTLHPFIHARTQKKIRCDRKEAGATEQD